MHSRRVLLCNGQAGGRLWREIREVPLLRYVFAVSRCDELANARNQIEQAQYQFIRISVEIAANAPKFGRPEVGTWVRDSESRKNIGFRTRSVKRELTEAGVAFNLALFPTTAEAECR